MAGPSKVLRINVLSGLSLILIALIAWFQVEPLEIGTIKYFGPGMLPRGLSMILFVAGVIILVTGIFQRESSAQYFRSSWRGPVMIMAALVAFAATIKGGNGFGMAVPQFGLVVAGPLAFIIAGYASPEANLRDLAALSFGLTAVCTLIFNDLLGLAIPILPDGLETPLSEWLGWDMAPRAAYFLYGVIAAVIVVAFPRTVAESSHENRTEADGQPD